MKTLMKLFVVFALFALSGCTFDTDVDADVNLQGEGKCDGLRALMDAENDPETKSQLADAYRDCLDDSAPEPSDGNDTPGGEGDRDDPEDGQEPGDDPTDGTDPNDCQTVERQTADGDVVEERHCPSGDDDQDPDRQIDCDEVIHAVDRTAEGNIDEDTEWWAVCADLGYEDHECDEILQQCLNQDGSTDPNDGDVDDASCQRIHDELLEAGVDPESLSAETVYDLCIQAGYDDAICSSVADACFPGGTNDDPDSTGDIDCAQVNDYLEQEGYDTPLDETTAEALYDECVQRLSDSDEPNLSPEICDELLQCVMP